MRTATSPTDSAGAEMPYNRLRTALALFGKPPVELDPDERQRVYAQAEREYQIEQRILQAPEAIGVMVGAAELARALEEIRAKYPDEEAFRLGLEAGGLDEGLLRQALARQCKVNTVLDKVVAATPVEISEVEIGIYYHAHYDKFQQPERRDAHHILISINEDFPENSRPRAMERIMALAEKLGRKPWQFAELAQRHSECPTAMRGGRIGLVRRGQLYPELDAALFRLHPDELSGVVETEIGFHLVLCKTVEPPHTLSLKKATPHIRAILDERTRESRRRQWIAGLLPFNPA
jgi:peptidyl-prolyl cis-trans isomerase C